MLGYVFAILVLVILLPLVFALAARGRGPRPSGKSGQAGHPVQRDEPAADEPTPDVDQPKDRDGHSRVPPA
jgi:hypothetical protein